MARTVNGAAYNMPKKCGGVCGRRRRHERRKKGEGTQLLRRSSEKGKGWDLVVLERGSEENETAVVVYEERRVREFRWLFYAGGIKKSRRFGVGGRERE
ncbi:hypothetical protein HAX54_028738 [Datura stramonium]|uniref:Uncharacterized protein n=1 Tax=Datura stramonium TaxID=4076 RepID=A0ABS8V7E1_DATST|nr:hypothetical protein [Datura stramonium]